MDASMVELLQHLTLMNFFGLMSIPAAIVGVAWRLSSRLTTIEVTLREYADANVRDHKLILASIEKQGKVIVNHGERIAGLEGGAD